MERWLNEERQKYSNRKTHNCHWEKNNTAKDLMVWIPNNMQQHTTRINIVDTVIYLLFWIIESLSLSLSLPSLFMCEICSLILTGRYFPTVTRGPFHLTMTQKWLEFPTSTLFTTHLSVPFSSTPCPCGVILCSLHTWRVSNMPICLSVN